MILVTGASEGIGLACARALLERTDAELLLTGRRVDALERAREQLCDGLSARIRTFVCDQARAFDVEALIALIACEPRLLEGAILTVGVNPRYQVGPLRLDAMGRDTLEDTVRTNCTHTLRLSAALLGRLRRQRSGVLAWIGSRGARVGLPGAAVYCATKSFLSGLAAASHREYAGRGVRVHLLHPGLVRTPRTQAIADDFAAKWGIAVAEACDVASRIVDVFLTGNGAEVEQDV